jgi:hypothetical protein
MMVLGLIITYLIYLKLKKKIKAEKIDVEEITLNPRQKNRL